MWWGSVVSTVIWAAVVPFTGGLGTDDLAGFWLGVSASAVMHVAYMLVLQRGYAAGDLSTVYAVARGTGPLLSVVVAVTLLGEQLSGMAVIGVVAIIVGVVAIGFVDRLGTGARRGIRPDAAIAFGLLTGVAIAIYTVWDAFSLRQWSISPVAYMVGCTALEIPLFTALLIRGGRWRALVPVWRRDARRLVAFGVLSPLSYILVLTAITMAPVAIVAPVREVSVVLVSLFGAFVLREAHPARRVVAAVVVAGGIVLLAL